VVPGGSTKIAKGGMKRGMYALPAQKRGRRHDQLPRGEVEGVSP